MDSAQDQQAQIMIHRQQGQNQFFEESLPGGVRLRMMAIPAGTFLMGSSSEELDQYEREGPQHEVTVGAFFMGKYPVTQAQWRSLTELPSVERELKPEPSHFKGEIRPVEQVSWDDAVEFCARLSAYTNRSYRLPTEAEWEYACRAGTTTPFHFGETITTDLVNYRGTDNQEAGWSGSYGSGPKGEYREETTSVAHFGLANAFGLCEMHGNVREWCQDYWHENYQGAPPDGSAWLEQGDQFNRVLRGGSWLFSPRYCRSTYRNSFAPAYAYYDIGFRVVCSAPRAL